MALAVQCGGTLLAGMGKLFFADVSGESIKDFSCSVEKAIISEQIQEHENWRSDTKSCHVAFAMEAECIPLEVHVPATMKTFEVKVKPNIRASEAFSVVAAAIGLKEEDVAMFAGSSYREAMEKMDEEAVKAKRVRELRLKLRSEDLHGEAYDEKLSLIFGGIPKNYLLEDVRDFSKNRYVLVGSRDDFSFALQLFLKTLTGSTIAVEVTLCTLVHQVKLMFDQRQGLPPDQQRFLFDGR